MRMFLISLYVFLYPFDLFAFLNVGGYGVTFQIQALIVVLFLTVFYAISEKKVSRSSMFLVILFLFVISFYGVLIPLFIGGVEFVEKSLWSSIYFCVFLSSFVVMLEARSFSSVVRGLYYSALLVFVYAIYQFMARRIGWSFDYLDITNHTYLVNDVSRSVQPPYYNASSFFLEPSYLGRFSVIMFFISAYVFEGVRKRVVQLLSIVSAILSFSFGSFLIFILMSVSVIAIYKRYEYLKYVPIVLLAVLVMLITNDDFNNRVVSFLLNFLNPQEVVGSYSLRLEGMVQAIDAFYSYPILGSGFSVYKLISGSLGTDSQFFEILYQFGLVGLIIYIFMLYKLSRVNRLGEISALLIFYYMAVFNGLFDLLNAMLIVLPFLYQKKQERDKQHNG